MTELERIEALEKDMLAPKDVAKCLGCTPYLINVATRDGKNPFPFPVIRINSRVRIPKIPFVKAMRGELPIITERTKTNEEGKSKEAGYGKAGNGDRDSDSCPI